MTQKKLLQTNAIGGKCGVELTAYNSVYASWWGFAVNQNSYLRFMYRFVGQFAPVGLGMLRIAKPS